MIKLVAKILISTFGKWNFQLDITALPLSNLQMKGHLQFRSFYIININILIENTDTSITHRQNSEILWVSVQTTAIT